MCSLCPIPSRNQGLTMFSIFQYISNYCYLFVWIFANIHNNCGPICRFITQCTYLDCAHLGLRPSWTYMSSSSRVYIFASTISDSCISTSVCVHHYTNLCVFVIKQAFPYSYFQDVLLCSQLIFQVTLILVLFD